MVIESNADWLRTDTFTEAVRSLEHATEALEAGCSDAYSLKWAVHALCLSAQNFMLTTFNFADRRALDERWWAQWDQGFEGVDDYPERAPRTRLRDVYQHFKKRNPDFNPVAVKIGRELNDAFGMRDGFEHMPPQGYTIHADRLRVGAQALLRVIRYIVSERDPGPLAPPWEDEQERERVVRCLDRAEAYTR